MTLYSENQYLNLIPVISKHTILGFVCLYHINRYYSRPILTVKTVANRVV